MREKEKERKKKEGGQMMLAFCRHEIQVNSNTTN